MKWLVVAVCLIQAAQFAIASGVPVFVWGDTAYVTRSPPPLGPLSLTRDFSLQLQILARPLHEGHEQPGGRVGPRERRHGDLC